MITRLTVRGIIYNPQTDSVFVQKLKKLQGNNWYLPGGICKYLLLRYSRRRKRDIK